jgi:hypothetical protein
MNNNHLMVVYVAKEYAWFHLITARESDIHRQVCPQAVLSLWLLDCMPRPVLFFQRHLIAL